MKEFNLGKTVNLKKTGWNFHVKENLERLIIAGSGQNLPVVLDMDNTILCRDIGDATFAVLESQGKISKKNISGFMTPDFISGNETISLKTNGTFYNYYRKLMTASAVHPDLTQEAVAHSWAVEILQGLTPLEIIQATEQAFYDRAAYKSFGLPFETASLLQPYFYPEMIELVGVLLECCYDVWVISSTNTWSVRWALLNALNAALRDEGYQRVLEPAHLIGINTILLSPDNKMYKDEHLVRENEKYAHLDPKTLSQYKTSSLLIHPVAVSYGKIGQIFQWIGHRPYLAAGDSGGDLPMLKYAQNKLWIARLDSPEYQFSAALLSSQKLQNENWIIQPTLHLEASGFISSSEDLQSRKNVIIQPIEKSVNIFNSYGLLLDYKGEGHV